MATVAIPSWDTGYENAEAVIANRALARIGADFIREDTTENTPSSRHCQVAFPQTRDELLQDHDFNFAQRIATLVEDVGTTIANVTKTNASATIGFTGQTINALVGRTITGTGIPEDTVIISNTATVAVMSNAATDAATITATITQAKTPWEHVFILPSAPVVLKILGIAGDKENEFAIIGSGTSRRILCDVESSDGFLELHFVEQVINPAYWSPLFTDAFVLRLASKLAVPLVKRPDLAQALQAEFAAIYSLAKKASDEEAMLEERVPFWTERP
jgi:hypothetical protein